MEEIVRTIRQLFTHSDKNSSLREILVNSISSSLNDILDMAPEDIDAIMSFIPEASFKMISIGTPCVN